MAKKEFVYHGMKLEELQKLSLKEVAEHLPSDVRRRIKRGFTPRQKILLDKIEKGAKKLRTHARDMPILPLMVGKTIHVYTGKEFAAIEINPEMIGYRLGEFASPRKRVAHSAPGIGATRSSSALSVR